MKIKLSNICFLYRKRLLMTIMKTFIFLCCATVFSLTPNNIISQNSKIIVKEDKTLTVDEVFDLIMNQTDYNFFYEEGIFKGFPSVLVKKGVIRTDKLLKRSLLNGDYEIVITNNYDIQIKKEKQNVVNKQQGIKISGQITDGNNQPLPGANILEKGTTNGTQTDFDGRFSISVNDENAILVVSYIGFTTQEIEVKDKTSITITLKEDNAQLDEIVVVAYGVKKAVSLTGAVTSIKGETVQQRPSANVLSMLQGVAPGVTVVNSPNGGTSINIRGLGNLGSSSPLFVVDGTIVSSGVFQNLDPSSIESMSVLKDAASAAIYGSRAAYGVVLVTTKSGESGKLQISYEYNIGLRNPTYIPKYLGSKQFLDLYHEAAVNSGMSDPPYYADYNKFDGSDPDHFPNTDWYDLMLNKNAMIKMHSINASGGSDKTRYATNLAYTDSEDIFRGPNTKRYNFSSNVSSELTSFLELKTGIKLIKSDFNTLGSYSSIEMNRLAPTIVGRHTDGTYGSIEGGSPYGQAAASPLYMLEKGGDTKIFTNRTVLDVALNIKPLKGLVVTPSLSYFNSNTNSSVFENKNPQIINFDTKQGMIGTSTDINKLTVSSSYINTLMAQLLASYNYKIGEDHDFSALAGYTYEDYHSEGMSASRTGFYSNTMRELSSGSPDPIDQSNDHSIGEYALLSSFGRLNYDYKGKYFLEGTIRADKSSRFPVATRLGVFPSVSAAWRLSEEDFIATILPNFSNIKLRASYGTLGSIDNVGNYSYFEDLQITDGYNFEDQIVQGAREGRIANPNLTWENVETTNFGLDINWKNGLIGFVGDYYIRNTSDILITLPASREAGLRPDQLSAQNIAEVENIGVELNLTHSNAIGNDFKYGVTLNYFQNWNKIGYLAGADPIINGVNVFKVGQARGTYYMIASNGLYSQSEIDAGDYVRLGTIVPQAGDIKYIDQITEDTNGDGVPDATDGIINGDDRTYVGQNTPKITFGGTLSAQYKNFGLSVLAQGVSGVKTYLSIEASRAFFNGGKVKEYHYGRWTPENPDPNAVYPRMELVDNHNFEASDFWLFNSDYIRIKNINFSYNIPKQSLDQIGLKEMMLYFSGENLFTIRGDKRMKDFDPEVVSTRSLISGTKTVSFGLRITY